MADRSPAKQGRLLPGSRMPVVAPEALRRDPPDDLLILPWNLAVEIAGEMRPLRAAGTLFWVAVPALRPVLAQPRPTNGIFVAITVMNCTLASSGRLAM